MSEDPTQIISHDDRNGLRDEVHSINLRLERLEEKFDERSRETRPMSERIDQLVAISLETRQDLAEVKGQIGGMQNQIGGMQNQIGGMQGQISKMESQVGKMQREMRDINRTLHRMNVDFATSLRNQDELDDRVTVIEDRFSRN